MRASSGSMCVQRPHCAAGSTRLSHRRRCSALKTSPPVWYTRSVSTSDQSQHQTGLVDQTGLKTRSIPTPDWSQHQTGLQTRPVLVDQTGLVLRPVW